MSNLCGIYSITNKINGKRYIGQSKNIIKRFCEHKSDLKNNIHGNPYLQSSWNKYGNDIFKFEVLCEEKEENLNELEAFVIELLGTFTDRTKGYNLTSGGDNCKRCITSEETKKKISLANTGKKRSEETKEKQRLLKLGGKHSKEHNIKIGLAGIGNQYHSGLKHSEETKRKIGLAGIGRKHSEEAKRKIGLSKLGRKRSEETKKKISESKKARWNKIKEESQCQI